MEKNLRTFADWFMKQQEEFAENKNKIKDLEMENEAKEDFINYCYSQVELVLNMMKWGRYKEAEEQLSQYPVWDDEMRDMMIMQKN